MASDGDSFLPRIQSVFYACFDTRQGPKIIYQVPEGLIEPYRQESITPAGPSVSSTATPSVSASASAESGRPTLSRHSSSSMVSPGIQRRTSRHMPSPQKRVASVSTERWFYFEDISKYVIPASALCGRLVKCTTRNHRIIGFPVELLGDYERNAFRYNVCFVFDKTADLSCYEPVVRKVGRVLTACEEESHFLSSPKTAHTVHAILEQLYEDLNSYSETSIPIDQFNSIELKIFPFYPNPPPVNDWQVPLALINLKKIRESNWDLTMVKVCDFIDGTNHVSRIAHLADCDKTLTRQAISHLLYYQVIMMIDIFQFSNMYTLRKSIQWLADESHVIEECGPYVTKLGKQPPDWPKLLHLYSRLKPGIMVWEWMRDHDVQSLGIDVRRFLSFGVIKGFLRRVHRFPILLDHALPPEERPAALDSSPGRKRVKSLPTIDSPSNEWAFPVTSPNAISGSPEAARGRMRKVSQNSAFAGSDAQISPLEPYPASGDGTIAPSTSAVNLAATAKGPNRRFSEAENALEQLRSRSGIRGHTHRNQSPVSPSAPPPSPQIGRARRPRGITHDEHVQSQGGRPEVRRRSMTPNALLSATKTPMTVGAAVDLHRARSGSTSATAGRLVDPEGAAGGEKRSRLSVVLNDAPRPPRFSRSPSAPIVRQPSVPGQASVAGQSTSAGDPPSARTSGGLYLPFPKKLVSLMNGEHHTDELGTRFEAGWPLLERWLREVGGGQDTGDFGRVAIIYR